MYIINNEPLQITSRLSDYNLPYCKDCLYPMKECICWKREEEQVNGLEGEYFTKGKILMNKRVEREIDYLFRKMLKDEKEILVFLFIRENGKDADVYDYMLPKQKVSKGKCDPDEDFMQEWMLKNRNNPKYRDFRGWMHSHALMGCFWSYIDDDYTRKWTQVVNGMMPRLFLSIVSSFKGDNRNDLTRLDINSSFGRVMVNKLKCETYADKGLTDEEWNERLEISGRLKELNELINQNVKEIHYRVFDYFDFGKLTRKQIKKLKKSGRLDDIFNGYEKDDWEGDVDNEPCNFGTEEKESITFKDDDGWEDDRAYVYRY